MSFTRIVCIVVAIVLAALLVSPQTVVICVAACIIAEGAHIYLVKGHRA